MAQAKHPLSFDQRQQLTSTALTVVNTMVKKGFTFFSSVKIDTRQHKYHVDVQYAVVDSMFFRLPGHAALIQIDLSTHLGLFGKGALHTSLKTEVMLESAAYYNDVKEYDRQMKLAEEKDYTTQRFLSEYDAERSTIFDLPFLHCDPELVNWTYHGGSRSRNRTGSESCHLRLEASPLRELSTEEIVSELADRLLDMKLFLSAQRDGRFNELMTSIFWPHYTFPTSEADFYSAFNMRYLRPYVRHAY